MKHRLGFGDKRAALFRLELPAQRGFSFFPLLRGPGNSRFHYDAAML
jgi:hypothetical protein